MLPRFIYTYDEDIQTHHTNCVIVGGGIAGLYTALTLDQRLHITLITKDRLEESNTSRAQGGMAAVFSELDSFNQHISDTLLAGAGLCDAGSVQILVSEGPDRVRDLIRLGVQFDLKDGQLALTQEGAHTHRRILHAHGDATGAEVVRGLVEQVRQRKNITLLEHTHVLDLHTEKDVCQGVFILTQKDHIQRIKAQATILATGGIGQLYLNTSNPEGATGDGIALAFRAGAHIQDMEFVQFHPTVLKHRGAPTFLISEAVRGEGGVLRNSQGERFMPKAHELAELAPRDVVTRAIVNEMEQTNHPAVYLDMTHASEGQLQQRFPTIFKTLQQFGLNMAQDWIPVAPAAHYLMGGILTDEHGESTVKSLYACGEVASTGVHGANRLASNSLTEAIVYGYRIAKHIEQQWDKPKEYKDAKHINKEIQQGTFEEIHQDVGNRTEDIGALKDEMQRYVGVRRTGSSLQQFVERCQEKLLSLHHLDTALNRQEIMWRNMLTCSMLIARSALLREESRGGHYRNDFPRRNDEQYRRHHILYFDHPTGQVKGRWVNVTSK
ncbi:L-aspartate oxidase [Bacillus horti]|uniref:L-aspartate oxidase n=1 Tax=Caldalkalibacillus horti TaxID=77523 RepID=A0ABT9W2Y2_9BACI|nr:L-aspartate oxidase [Bacillus horti]MDQ0167602.1 L-aspartate oxidase [Bacillus horti]